MGAMDLDRTGVFRLADISNGCSVQNSPGRKLYNCEREHEGEQPELSPDEKCRAPKCAESAVARRTRRRPMVIPLLFQTANILHQSIDLGLGQPALEAGHV